MRKKILWIQNLHPLSNLVQLYSQVCVSVFFSFIFRFLSFISTFFSVHIYGALCFESLIFVEKMQAIASLWSVRRLAWI